MPENGDPCFAIETPDGSFHLAAKPGTERYEFVEERTSGSTPRAIQWVADESGSICRFTLHSPMFRPQTDWRSE